MRLRMQEYAPGGDLYAALAAAGGFLPEPQVASCVMLPLLTALVHVHNQARPAYSIAFCIKFVWCENCSCARHAGSCDSSKHLQAAA